MNRSTRLTLSAITLASAFAILNACSQSAGELDARPTAVQSSTSQASETPIAPNAAIEGELTIFAAASLQSAFDELVERFEADYPKVQVRDVVYDGSSTLVMQLTEGAVADVLATADEANMNKAVAADLIVGTPEIFATNTLQIAVAPQNPLGISGLADLAEPSVLVVLCASEVPCGAAGQKALSAAGVAVVPVSEEQNVKAVVTKVAQGEADAGLVYATDVAASDGALTGIDFPESEDAVNSYPIATLSTAANPDAAQAFSEYVLSAAGQEILKGYGFASR